MPAYPHWASSQQRVVLVGPGHSIPADPENTEYAALVASGVPINAAPAELPAVDDVKVEANRRILARYPVHTQLNMLARGTELVLLGPQNWTSEQAAEAAALQGARNWINSVRAVSNALEVTRPADYTADQHWPA